MIVLLNNLSNALPLNIDVVYHITGIDLPCCDMVFMPRSESKTANEQRAARALRLCSSKQNAVIAMWADRADMIGLCDLAYSAYRVRAVTSCLESTDAEKEKTVADVFEHTANIQMNANINGIPFKYEFYINLIAEFKANGGKLTTNSIYKDAPLGTWVETQQQSFRKGLLDSKKIELCHQVGIVLQKTISDSMNTEEVYLLLEHCTNNGITVIKNMPDIQYKNKTVNPSNKLRSIRGKWSSLTSEQKEKFKAIGFDEKSDTRQKMWNKSFQTWKSKSVNGKVDKRYHKEYVWQRNQRAEHAGTAKNKLSEIKFEKLNSVGFKWVD